VIIIRNRNIYGNGLCTGVDRMGGTRLKPKNLTLPSYISRNTFSYPEIFWKIKNGRLPLAAFSPPSGLKIFQNFKNRILPHG
jgi:hypothetical protein